MDKKQRSIDPWLRNLLRIYWQEVRPNFIPEEGLTFRPFFFHNDDMTSCYIKTQRFFITSTGSENFRARSIPYALMAKMKTLVKNDEEKQIDTLKRKILKMLPVKNDPAYQLASETVLIQAVKDALLGSPLAENRNLEPIVKRRHSTLRDARNAARARVYVEHNPKPRIPETNEKLVEFGIEKEWPEVTDLSRLMEKVNILRSDKKRVSSRMRKYNGNLNIRDKGSREFQLSFKFKCEEQEWQNLGVIFFGDEKGRGVVALAPFQKDDVVIDYHGLETMRSEYSSVEEYCAENPDRRQMHFCVEVKTGNMKRLIDASLEPCSQHPGRSCLGRLINHASYLNKGMTNKRCNLKLMEVSCPQLTLKGEKVFARATFVALRNIPILEELLFDYGDKAAQQMFGC